MSDVMVNEGSLSPGEIVHRGQGGLDETRPAVGGVSRGVQLKAVAGQVQVVGAVAADPMEHLVRGGSGFLSKDATALRYWASFVAERWMAGDWS